MLASCVGVARLVTSLPPHLISRLSPRSLPLQFLHVGRTHRRAHFPCALATPTQPSSLRHQGPHVHHHEVRQPGDVRTGWGGDAEGDEGNISSTPSVTNFPGSSSSPCSAPLPTRRTPFTRAPRSHTSSRLSTVRGVPEWGHRLVWDTVLWGTLRNQGFCKFVRVLVWREVARVVGAEDAVRCPSVRREGSNERAYYR